MRRQSLVQSASCEYSVLSGRGPYDETITRPEEVCVCVCVCLSECD